MPIVYLQPSDLSAVQAERVLAFLNAATSAEQLARDIEFPREPEIGVRLGQRLLDARAALGGSFSDILQVRAVRLIGPERFTEICVAALGLDPTRWVELFYGGEALATPTESGLVLSLALHPQDAWLGEPCTLHLQCDDHGGTPRAGVAVTVQASLGRLVYLYGFHRIEGQAVTVLTGSDGSAELELLTPPTEPLTENQQAALETALAALDPRAAHPLALEAGLKAMAEAYLRDRSYSLRTAIDLYVRDAHGAAVDTISRERWKLAWPVDSGLIQADVLDAGGAAAASRARCGPRPGSTGSSRGRASWPTCSRAARRSSRNSPRAPRAATAHSSTACSTSPRPASQGTPAGPRSGSASASWKPRSTASSAAGWRPCRRKRATRWCPSSAWRRPRWVRARSAATPWTPRPGRTSASASTPSPT